MSTSEIDKPNGQKVTLTVRTVDPETEIFIIDGEFQLVARGVGFLQVQIQPGIYKVKYRAGAVTDERLVLAKDRPIEVSVPQLSFSSPAPLVRTAKTHEYHMDAARNQSRNIHVKSGTGSWIFVFARDWTVSNNSANSENPSQWLSLDHEQGNPIADLDKAGSHGGAGDPWAACNLEVAPGTYRLRLDIPAKNGQKQVRLEQAIVASPGYQTQVFLLRKAYGPQHQDWAADLGGGAILLSRGPGFDPTRGDLRQTELARLGLTNRRQLISTEILDLLKNKFDNPMLGILGAHLLLLDPQIDQSLLSTVVQNLRSLLGLPHPDVEAISLQLKDATSYSFSVPPMLRRSWELLVAASTKRSSMIVPNSLAAGIWDRLWAEGPWLVWEVPEARTPEGAKGLGLEGPLQSEDTALLATLREYVRPRPSPTVRPTSSPFAAIMKMQSSPTAFPKGRDLDTLADVGSAKGSLGAPQILLEDEKIKGLARTLAIPEENLRSALNQVYGTTEGPADESEK